MKPFATAIIVSLLLPPACFSTIITIDVDLPYGTGSKTFSNTSLYRDSIQFSNGVLVYFQKFSYGTIENMNSLHSIIIDSPVKAGLKFLPSAVEKVLKYDISSKSDSVKFYSSSDTLWTTTKNFPDSLAALDSVIANGSGSTISKRGKWLYSTLSTIDCAKANSIDSYNLLIFSSTPKNKMKLQILHLYINTHTNPQPGQLPNILMDSLQIKWAVDSAGNGQFKANTAIKKVPNTMGSRNFHNFRGCNTAHLHEIANSGQPVEFFSISGRKASRSIASPQASGLPAGVLFYKINAATKTDVTGTIIVR